MKYVFKKFRYKILIPLFDLLGNIIFIPLRFFKRRAPSNPKNILIVRLDHIGDFVCTTPIFKNLKDSFPDSKITVLTNSISKELAYRDPAIDKVITFSPFYLTRGNDPSMLKGLKRVIKDVKNIGFDLGIDPRGDLMSILIMWRGGVKYRVGYGITGGGFLLHREGKYDRNMHIIDRNLALLKELDIPAEDRTPTVYFNDKDKEVVEELLKGIKGEEKGFRGDQEGKGRAVVIHPFAGAKAKEWTYANFQNLIYRLKNEGRSIILIGSEKDKGLFADVIDIRGRLNLPQLACLIKRVNFFIGLDSGPANIAAALNVPSVIICSGTNVPQLWIPNNSNVRFVNKYMTAISVDDVMSAIKELGR